MSFSIILIKVFIDKYILFEPTPDNTRVIDQCAVLLDLAALRLLRLLITEERAKNVYKISHYQSPHLAGSWHSELQCCEQLDNDNLLTQGHRSPELLCSLMIAVM